MILLIFIVLLPLSSYTIILRVLHHLISLLRHLLRTFIVLFILILIFLMFLVFLFSSLLRHVIVIYCLFVFMFVSVSSSFVFSVSRFFLRFVFFVLFVPYSFLILLLILFLLTSLCSSLALCSSRFLFIFLFSVSLPFLGFGATLTHTPGHTQRCVEKSTVLCLQVQLMDECSLLICIGGDDLHMVCCFTWFSYVFRLANELLH